MFELRTPPSCTLLPPVTVIPLLPVTSPFKLVVATMPFILEERSPVEVEKETPLEEITELVATTPLIVVVRVLPESDWVKELIRLVKLLAMPLITVANELVVVLRELEFIKLNVVLDALPFIVDVIVAEFEVVAVLRLFVMSDEAEVVDTFPAASVVRSPPERPANRTVPVVVSCADGVVVPIPTLPVTVSMVICTIFEAGVNKFAVPNEILVPGLRNIPAPVLAYGAELNTNPPVEIIELDPIGVPAVLALTYSRVLPRFCHTPHLPLPGLI